MQRYDPTQPLIFIHVPKTAGKSVYDLAQTWFPGRVARHYYSEAGQRLPEKHDLTALDAPRMIYGHFNRMRGFGVEDYYPEVTQFLTFLRDPFDMHVSRYFYTRRVASNWAEDREGLLSADLTEFIETGHLNMLEHFPREMTRENYREVMDTLFVDIGIFETLATSFNRMAARVGQTGLTAKMPHINATARTVETFPAELRRHFRERFPLEHMVYDYALEGYRDRAGDANAWAS